MVHPSIPGTVIQVRFTCLAFVLHQRRACFSCTCLIIYSEETNDALVPFATHL
jgi:hypothetical protein